jgi:hypothetical protein
MSEKTGRKPAGETWFNIFMMVACVALAVVVLLLAMQNRELKAQLAQLSRPQIPPEALKQGDSFVPLVLLDDSGAETPLRFGPGEPRSLLLFFSTNCPACRQTLPVWSELLEAPPAGLRVAGVRTGSQVEDIPYLSFPVYTVQDATSLVGKIPYIPSTLILDSEGTVEQVWYGGLDESQLEELSRALGLTG